MEITSGRRRAWLSSLDEGKPELAVEEEKSRTHLWMKNSLNSV
jgi:hypothetical protein